MNRSALSPASNISGLDINGVIQANNSALPITNNPRPVRPSAVDVPYTKVNTATAPAPTPPPASDAFDWNSFFASLTHSSQTQNPVPGDTSISDAYAFVPTGLISAQTQADVHKMTATQKALYNWGNDAGGAIQSYENNHPDQPAILTNFMQDRQNPAKIAAMKQLGADLQAIGNSFDTLMGIPPQLSTAAPALADAYREIGRNLAIIPDAAGDEATVKAILTYDKSAEEFVHKFVAVALILQANGIQFTQDEGGGVFMFPNSDTGQSFSF